MKHCRLSGIVLAVSGFGESDKLVTMYCAELGLIRAIAKGAKRSKKRFVNKLELFSHLELICRPPRHNGLFFLLEAELTKAFLCLRSDHRLFVTAGYITELLLRFSREQERDSALFPLLHWSLSELERGRAPLRVAAVFHLRLLGLAGYQPELHTCNRCGQPVENLQVFFLDPGNGGLICGRCRKGTGKTPSGLSLQAVRFMQVVQQASLEKTSRFHLPGPPVREILRMLHRYSVHILQRDINSFRLLTRLDT